MLKNPFFISIVFIALLAVGYYNWNYFHSKRSSSLPIGPVSPSPKTVAASSPILQEPEASERQGLPEKYPGSAELASMKELIEERDWGRNPFIRRQDFKKKVERVGVSAKMPTERAKRLEGVLISSAAKVAIIDGLILQEGDWIGDEQVIEISREGVVMESAGRFRILTMQGESMQKEKESGSNETLLGR